MPNIIALSGYAQSGKDTVANYLVEQHGYEKVAFADALRECLYVLNPNVVYKNLEPFPVQHLLRWFGYEALKANSPEFRGLLQRLGTEVGRQILGEDTWVDAAFAKIDPDSKYVISDCRFLNEATTVQAEGGVVLRVHRDQAAPVNLHSSETALDNFAFDGHIFNNATLEDLYADVDEMLGMLKETFSVA